MTIKKGDLRASSRKKGGPNRNPFDVQPSANPFEVLPDEVTLLIFSFFSRKEITEYARVCKDWRRLAQDSALWRKFNAYKDVATYLQYKLAVQDALTTSQKCLAKKYKTLSFYLLPPHNLEIWNMPLSLSEWHQVHEARYGWVFRNFIVQGEDTNLFCPKDEKFDAGLFDKDTTISFKKDKQQMVFLALVKNPQDVIQQWDKVKNIKRPHAILFIIKKEDTHNFEMLPQNSVILTASDLRDFLTSVFLVKNTVVEDKKIKSHCRIS